MKPEYQFKVEGLVSKEQVVSGLMASGYILSVNKRFGDIYEISVYGKERVDGKGLKKSDWFEKMDKPEVTSSPWKTTGVNEGIKVTSGIGTGTITTTKIPDTWIHNGSETIITTLPHVKVVQPNVKKDETFWIDNAEL
jgi:hypothetical protein